MIDVKDCPSCWHSCAHCKPRLYSRDHPKPQYRTYRLCERHGFPDTKCFESSLICTGTTYVWPALSLSIPGVVEPTGEGWEDF